MTLLVYTLCAVKRYLVISSITWSKVDWFRQFSNFEPPFSLLTTIKTLLAWKHILLIFRGNKFSRSWDSRHNIQGLSLSANWLTWQSELWQDILRTAMTSRVKKNYFSSAMISLRGKVQRKKIARNCELLFSIFSTHVICLLDTWCECVCVHSTWAKLSAIARGIGL